MIEWDQPALLGGYQNITYTVQLENINGGVEIWANLERTWHEFTFLRISFQYKVTVFAVNSFGKGEKATLTFRLVDTP